MSKTTVTQLVQQLEARLRVKLLNRTTRKVNVTADGAAYYERVVRLLADMDDAEISSTQASRAPRGRLRVDVPSPLARMILAPAFPAFHARYPDIQVHMGVSDRMVDLIDENVDCVLRGGEPGDPSLVARHVGDLGIGLYAAPAYLARVGRPAHPRELEAAPHQIVGFLRSSTGRTLPCTLRRGEERVQVLGRYAIAMDDGNAYGSRCGVPWGALVAALHGCATSGVRRTRTAKPRTGPSNRCRYTSPFHPTATWAPGCASLSTGWSN